MAQPIRTLSCCCCGERFQGRQFHNQDTGFGMGPCCADWVLNRRPFGHEQMTLEEFERTYGKRGLHFGIGSKDNGPSFEDVVRAMHC